MFDRDAFEERAAIAEYDGGLSRFAAETLAAKAQGMSRWEAMNEIRQRDTGEARDNGSSHERNAADNLPRVQPHAQEQDGQVPVSDIQAGRDRLALLALSVERRGVSR